MNSLARDWMGEWLADADARDSVSGPSVLDQIKADPANVMRLAGMEPDPWQEHVLRSPWLQMMLLCARQTGKSMVTAALALHQALTADGSLTLLISRAERQSIELFRKVMDFYRALKRPVAKANDMSSELHLANGSRIIPLPGTSDSIVGYTADLLILDEAARIPDMVYRVVRPMLAVKRGRLLALSTPFGKRGWFHGEWEWLDDGGKQRPKAEDTWQRVKKTVRDCPRISEEFLRSERASMGGLTYRQEYDPVDFVDTVESVFAAEQIEAAFRGEPFGPLFSPQPAPAGIVEGGEAWEPLFKGM